MIKTRLLLASLLKPVNDSRFYEKLGLSIGKLPTVEVHISGYNSPIPSGAPQNLFFHPLFCFRRLSLGRIFAQFIYLKFLFRLKPQVIIIGTHELLLSSLLYKAFYSCLLIYDVRENYYLNLTSQHIYTPIISRLAAHFIRFIEKITAPFISTFFLAEESYAKELPFIGNKFLVLQNKYKPAAPYALPQTSSGICIPANGNVNLLYSGTISELYGIFEAIWLADALHQISPRYTLTIIGYWPQATIGQRIKELIHHKPFITLLGGDEMVPHTDIIQAIDAAHVGLLPYYPHPSLIHCLPTKLFEYLAHALPIIVQQNPVWENIIIAHQAGFSINFQDFDPLAIIKSLEENTFYRHVALNDVYWQSEEDILLNLLNGKL
ncbi:MAG: glycosyltransferase [Cytophagales bacterium CG18_big_fil_WC_8_21_14_2_50_42_9]|nr:MAG: glycosyltransferase [Cytophagales bacterium CG18_big_fil_WC_8_21_14_2_50_42_9]